MKHANQEMILAGARALADSNALTLEGAAAAIYTEMQRARPRKNPPRKDLVAFVNDVATTAAGSNSDPDVMGRALDDIVARAQGLLKRMAEGS